VRSLVAVLRSLRAERKLLPRLRPFARLLVRRRGTVPYPAVASAQPAASAPRARPPAGEHPLTVVSVIRNGVLNGYPFVEAYGSWARWVDRILVVDGGSTDGTDRVLAQLAGLVPQLEVASRPWPAQSVRGSAIAELSDTAVALARDGSARLMYVQADEIYTETQRELVRGWRDGALRFAGYVNFWNSMERVLANEPEFELVRLLPPDAPAASIGDGYSFDVGETPVTAVPERVLHYGWCFPVNILRKHVSHAKLYPESPAYRLRGLLARRMLTTRSFDPDLLDALAPQYRPVPFAGEHPACMRHLVGLSVYDPGVGLELLAKGVRW